MATGEKITSAVDFFKKYNLDRECNHKIDQDLAQDGVQNDSINIDEFIADYQSLPNADRYAAFVRLQKCGDSEVLKRTTNFFERSKPFQNKKVNFKQAFRSFIADMKKRVSSSGDIWEKRLEIAEGLFAIDTILAAMGMNHNESLKLDIAAGLSLLYSATQPKKGTITKENPLFDTDNDFDPYTDKNSWDAAFDDRDILPLDPEYSSDRDGDGVGDVIDSAPDDPSEWTRLIIGDKYHPSCNYLVERISADTFEISVTFSVKADSRGNVENINETLLNDDALAKRKKAIEDAFDKAVERGKYKFKLNINFEVSDAHAAIQFSDRKIKRGNNTLWDINILNDPNVMLHEIFHNFGEPDYYNEVTVDAGARDFTTKPGYGILAANHLMVCAPSPVIPQHLLLKMAAYATRDYFPENEAPQAPVFSQTQVPHEEEKTVLDEVPKDFQTYIYIYSDRAQMYLGLDKRLSEIESQIEHEDDSKKRDGLLFAKAYILFLQTKNVEASRLMMEIFGRNKDDLRLSASMQRMLEKMGDLDNALIIAKNRVEKGNESEFSYATLLSKAGRFEEALSCLEDSFKTSDVVISSASRVLWLTCVFILGEYEKLDDYLNGINDNRSRIEAASFITGRLFSQGDIARADRIYWKYANKDSLADKNNYLYIMENSGLKKEAFDWFMQNIFPIINVCVDNEFYMLSLHANWFISNGLAKETVPLYEALLKRDPYNVDYNRCLAIALFAAGRNEDAAKALMNTAVAYNYMEERGLLPNLKFDELVEAISKQLRSDNYEQAFFDGFESIRRDPDHKRCDILFTIAKALKHIPITD